MAGYERQIATATRLIAAKGRACVWREQGEAPTDTGKPWGDHTPAVAADNDVSIVFLPHTSTSLATVRAIVGTDIPTGNDYGLMPAVGFTPTIDGTIHDKGTGDLLRSVLSITELAPNGDPILYVLTFGVEQ